MAFDPIDDTAGPRPLNSPAPAGDSLAPGSDLAAPFPEGDSSSDSSGSEEDDEYDSVLRASDLYSPREYARRGLLESGTRSLLLAPFAHETPRVASIALDIELPHDL